MYKRFLPRHSGKNAYDNLLRRFARLREMRCLTRRHISNCRQPLLAQAHNSAAMAIDVLPALSRRLPLARKGRGFLRRASDVPDGACSGLN
jgi:hypothetical protein